MARLNYLKDAEFLKQLDNQRIKTFFVKVIILDKNEKPIRAIEGRTTGGSIQIAGNSNVRRTGSLTFIADAAKNDLTNIENIFYLNKRVQIKLGIENNVDNKYNNIIWFPLGVFIVTQPSIAHSPTSVNISLSFKDKMCLLNGEMGGTFPASVTFHEYGQINADGSVTNVQQRIYDIIYTCVHNYGGEALSKIFVNDVPLEIKQIVRYVGSRPLYHNPNTGIYTYDAGQISDTLEQWISFDYNDDVGYVYIPFVYPGELISGIGENVCSVLDKIKSTLGNFEYFYDVDGNFVFQEIKNYLNTSYDKAVNEYRLDMEGKTIGNRKVEIRANGLSIIDETNYEAAFNTNSKSVYTFEQGSGLISAYNNTPNYTNVKNDFHIWGKNNDDFAIHYHLAIKSKPKTMNTYKVIFNQDEYGEKTGGISLAVTNDAGTVDIISTEPNSKIKDTLFFGNSDIAKFIPVDDPDTLQLFNNESQTFSAVVDGSTLRLNIGEIVDYTPLDWRAEIYCRGLEKMAKQQRPDIYEQEILDNFGMIYDFTIKNYNDQGEFIGYGGFREDMVKNVNNLKYFIDYLEPTNEIRKFSIDEIGIKKLAKQNDKVNKLFDAEVPDYILVPLPDEDDGAEGEGDMTQKESKSYDEFGQKNSNVSSNVFKNLSANTTGYSAHSTAREFLYQYTTFNEAISLTSIPIYYLDANTRITVNDVVSNIHGDYIISSISLPLDAKGTMTISATRALDRV